MNNFAPYFTKNKPTNNWCGYSTAFYTGVPMTALDAFRQTFPGQFRIRFRGPRNTVADRGRGSMARQSSCLKQNAVTFTAYRY
jgi:hypothetical protein